jgi:hypothetical protein
MPRALIPSPSVRDHAGPNAASIRFNRVLLGIVVLGVLVIMTFAGSSAYDAWRSYQYAINTTQRELGNLANALAEQTAWTLEAVDLLLHDTEQWYRGEGRDIPPEGVDAALEIRRAGVPQVQRIAIIDAQGRRRYPSGGSAAADQNLADRSYFTHQRDRPDAGLFLSEPLLSRTDGRAAVVLSRRLDDEPGHFARIVTATVDLHDLNQFYRAVDVGAGGAIQLLRDDGTLLVRNPWVPDAVGRRFPALVAPSATADFSNPIDGGTEFIAVAPVRAAHLTLAVTRDAAAALRPWRDETIRVGIRTLVIKSSSRHNSDTRRRWRRSVRWPAA